MTYSFVHWNNREKLKVGQCHYAYGCEPNYETIEKNWKNKEMKEAFAKKLRETIEKNWKEDWIPGNLCEPILRETIEKNWKHNSNSN